MLSYLAAALPANTSAAARLLALQCALRMNATMRVRLARGLLRSLRLDSPGPWRELEQARWLRPRSTGSVNEVGVELLDVTVLDQAPARPDRTQAADWALRVASPAAAQGSADPLLQLTALYLTAHTDPGTGTGRTDLDQMARACGTLPEQLPGLLGQLIAKALLASWQACWDTEELTWDLRTRSSRSPSGGQG
ncbi:hypothetical protein [Streptomyces tauricus]|uniref:hypothetical protein n=1 Tax=Streptomyces tauricus TaxID=68274 RepID=UPI0033A4BF54